MTTVLDEVLPEGLILIAASGMGDELDVPKEWADKQIYATTDNCIFIDHRTVAEGDVYSRVKVVVVGEPPTGARVIASTNIKSPTKLIYVGDHLKKEFKIFKVTKSEVHFEFYGQQHEHAYLISVLSNDTLIAVD